VRDIVAGIFGCGCTSINIHKKIRRGIIMVKLNGIVIAPMAVFCGIVSAAELYVNINGFAATMATGEWWVLL
jgi:hypothetical protein